MSKPDTTKVLMRHVIAGDLFSEDFQSGSKLYPTLSGEYITVMKMEDEDEDGEARLTVTSSFGEATVTKADLEADNGIVHIVDAVL